MRHSGHGRLPGFASLATRHVLVCSARPHRNFLLDKLVSSLESGLGENHTAAAMVVETIARYGCASTAMCYTMHTGAVAAALLRHHDNPALQDILKRIDKDCLIGTLSYSDPETGSHFWYPISSS